MTFLSFLGILFIGLKLANIIQWSWWLVLGPLYIPTTLFVLVLIGFTRLHKK